MSQGTVIVAPGLSSFLKSLKTTPVEPSVEHFISLLKRRQIRNSRPCAIATTALLLRVVGEFKGRDAAKLVKRIREVGRQLTSAQPREVVVGNIVRRVLGLVREVVDENIDGETNATSDPGHPAPAQHDSLHRPLLTSSISQYSPLKHAAAEPMDASFQSEATSDSGDISKRPPLLASHTSYAASAGTGLTQSLFGIFSQPETPSASNTPTGQQSPIGKGMLTSLNLERLTDFSKSNTNFDLKAEVMDGIRELQDELEQSDDLIAANALDHIHSNEIILTHTASTSVQKFLLAAARKRKFTVVHAETFPHDHTATHGILLTGKKRENSTVDEADWKPLIAAGIEVYVIPDSHVYAIMSRVNKVILATHTVLANGGLVAAAGAHMIAKAAKNHQVPVVVVSGVYKLSPVYPFDLDELIEYGDASSVVPYEDGDFVDKVDVEAPLFDYVPADLVDLYITNLGGHAPSFLYRIVADHYRPEDITL
ncbi:translation initiation factor eIF-2B subunit beta [Aaosphaeria arxii CBS 175.79]|uniref:Translation initiation factor eIF2B subunit beta n=1 Tax=Aaosphaeria arxii CBS 175.79 TaxID=1450172 RepID=A0A6A5XYX1_9PLEO|nr:translation initiation factor eIF-2B subunit beta [Aaosphaeria arxii CBS 175.79]KAF2018186.1 translation initiation factor eIF-2B subunit beta [Aaosphaeria arxii CBS 175.79]